MIIFDIFFISFSFIVFMCMFGYEVIVHILSKNKNFTTEKTKNLPQLSVIIPTYNEEKYIENKILNLFDCAYDPDKLHIYVADSNSADRTQAIVKQVIENKSCKNRLELVNISERGKTNAINKALNCITTEIVCISDADTILDKNALLELVSSFHEGVGAVGTYTIMEPKKLFYIKSKEKYLKKDWLLRCKEALIDSCCSLDGKTMAFNRTIIPYFPEDAVQDDYLLTLLLRTKGYRSIINPRAKVYEQCPASLSNEIEQKRRQIRQTLVLNFQYIQMLFNPRFGFYGIMTFPFRRFFPLMLPILSVYIAIYVFFVSQLVFLSSVVLFWFYLFISKNYYLPILFYSTSLALYDFVLNRQSLAEWKKIDT